MSSRYRRPIESDYDTIEEYEDALDAYERYEDELEERAMERHYNEKYC